MNTMDIWAQAEKQIERYDLLTHPFYEAWSSGLLTRREIGFYGRQYLEHVAAFPTYLTALHSRLPEGEMRRAVLSNAADEETRGVNHADLWRQFVCAIDGESSSVKSVLPEVKQLIETYRELGRSGPPVAALGAFYAYESQVPRVADAKVAGLVRFYGADEIACEYFTLHAKVDIEHAQVWHRLIDSVTKENSKSQSLAIDGMFRGARALWQALSGIEAARHQLQW